jgi:hypothetical protein
MTPASIISRLKGTNAITPNHNNITYLDSQFPDTSSFYRARYPKAGYRSLTSCGKYCMTHFVPLTLVS